MTLSPNIFDLFGKLFNSYFQDLCILTDCYHISTKLNAKKYGNKRKKRVERCRPVK